MPHSLSIIIATKNRPFDLELTVESILRQNVLPTQLIIVDQSQSEETQMRVRKMFVEAPSIARGRTQLCYVWDPTIPGLAAARNRGMEVAKGDVWVFLDDDVVLESNFLEELLAVYVQYPNISGVSGIITNYRRPAWIYRFWAWVFVRGPFHDERQPIYWRADWLRQAEPMRVRKFTGALMSFRAEAVRGHLFRGGVLDGEEIDFCARLGPETVLLIAPRARLVHRASPIGRAQDHWVRGCAQANYYLYYGNWKTGFKNRFSFMWLNVGLGLVATFASLRRGTIAPWRALRDGAREGARVTRPNLCDGAIENWG